MFCLHAETATSSDTNKVVVHSLLAHNYCHLQSRLEPFFFFSPFSVQIILQLSLQVFYYFFLSFFRFFFKYHVVLLQVIAFCVAVLSFFLSFFLLCCGFARFGWF